MERREFWGYAYLIMAAAIGGTLAWHWNQVLIFNRVFEFFFLAAVWVALALLAGPIVLACAKLAKVSVLGAWADTALAIGLVLLVPFAFYLFETSTPANLAAAEAYGKTVQPALEDYYREHGHYPQSLSQLNLPGPAPFGLSYHASDSGPLEWGAGKHLRSEHDKLSGTDYSLQYGDWYLLSTGTWAQGGL